MRSKATLRDMMSSKLKSMEATAKGTFTKMRASAAGFSKGVENAFSKIVNLKNAIIGFAAVKGLQVLVGGVAKLGDTFDKMSHRLQVSTVFLQELDHVANLAGSNVQVMEMGIRRLAKAAQDADEGMMTYVRSFEALNLEWRDNQGNMKEIDQLFWETTEALASVGSSTEKVALAQELLGRSGTALLPIVDAGAEAIKTQREEAHRLGGVMGKDAIAAARDYTDAMHRLNVVIRALQVKFIIPFIRDMADRIEGFVQAGGLEKLERQVQAVIRAGKIFFMVYSVSKVMALVKAFKALRLTLSTINPVMLAITAGAIALEAIISKINRQQELAEKAKNKAWWDSPETLQKLIKSREEFEKTNDKIKEANKHVVMIHGTYNAMLDRQLRYAKEVKTSAEDIIGYGFDDERAQNLTIEAMKKRIEEIKNIRKEEELTAQKRAEAEAAARKAEEARKASIAEAKRKEEEAEAKRLADREAFLEQMRQMEMENLSQTFEGRQAILDQQHAAALTKAVEYGEDFAAVDEYFFRKRQELNDQRKAEEEEKRKKIEEKQKKERELLDKKQEEANKKKIALNEKIKQSQIDTANATIDAMHAVLAATRGTAKAQKLVSVSTAIIQGYLAVQKAIASGVPPWNFITAGLVGIKTAANVAAMRAQPLQTGGFPRGRNALVQLNEQGQEAVLNAGAVAQLGFGGVNALNSGQPITQQVTNQISYSPTIQVEGEASASIVEALRRDKEEFAEFFEKDVLNRGYLVNQR